MNQLPNQPTNLPPSNTIPANSQTQPENAQPNFPLTDQTSTTSKSKTKPKLQDENEIKAQTINSLKISYLVLLILVVIFLILGFFINSRVKQLHQTQEQIYLSRIDSQNVDNTIDYYQTRQKQIESIINTLPTEETFIDFINTLEVIVGQHANQKSIDFNTDFPTGTTNEKYIPLSINLTTDSQNFFDLIKKLEKLPFILEITKIDSQLKDQNIDVWEYQLSGKIYVNNPFTLQ